MINPFDYYYYKIYTVWQYLNFGDYRHFAVIGILYIANINTLYSLIMNEFLSSIGFLMSMVVVIILLGIFYRSKREARILAKYRKESEQSRWIGNLAVTAYIIITVVSFIQVMKHVAVK